jgi:hypothetical protein
MKGSLAWMTIVLLSSVLCSGGLAAQRSSDLPAPRAPKRVRISKLEQLLPNARILVRRPYSWLVGAHHGLGLKQGEKLLIVASGIEPLVVQALVVAAQEMGVTTDVIARNAAALSRRAGREEFDYERFDPSRHLAFRGIVSRAVPDWLARMVDDYDMVLGWVGRGASYGKIGRNGAVRSARLDFSRAEQLASPSVSYPDELLKLISMKTWDILVKGRDFRITDPRGTDISFTIDETNLERLKETRGLATYGKKSLERPIANHASVQLEPQLNRRPDARGVMVTKQGGYIPQGIKIYFEGGKVTRVEGGGAVGENIREALKRFKNVQYPGYYPGPGVGWLEELAMGVNPKVGPAGPIRRRSGMAQLAFGTDRHNLVIDDEPTLPVNHRDIDFFYYMSCEVDGTKLVDNGHLRVLDDPEVRSIAAHYGNPDELLREDWIPEFDEESGQIIYPPYEEMPESR